jgi:DNA processing protein
MNLISIEDKKYPELLKEIGKTAPKQLHYKGNWEESIFENCLAVVGSRRMTTYGRQVAERIVGEAAAAGLTIVSGFMYGVDATAHKAALSVGGKTIAVMPCGIEIIHPEYQQDLYVEILNNNGLVISEYEGNMQPVTWTYPQRNRIVAGLSKAALIVEAGEKSGSLITACLAQKFKRKLFVVPGPITNENSKGIMQLIKNGATPISSAKDILDYYQIKNVRGGSSNKTSNNKIAVKKGVEQEIINQLRQEALDIDTISRNLGVTTAKLGTTLSLMQLRGVIKQEGNKYYVN